MEGQRPLSANDFFNLPKTDGHLTKRICFGLEIIHDDTNEVFLRFKRLVPSSTYVRM